MSTQKALKINCQQFEYVANGWFINRNGTSTEIRLSTKVT